MSKMNDILKQWIDKNFVTDVMEVTFIDDGIAVIKDPNGDELKVTMNLFCDIMEYGTIEYLQSAIFHIKLMKSEISCQQIGQNCHIKNISMH